KPIPPAPSTRPPLSPPGERAGVRGPTGRSTVRTANPPPISEGFRCPPAPLSLCSSWIRGRGSAPEESAHGHGDPASRLPSNRGDRFGPAGVAGACAGQTSAGPADAVWAGGRARRRVGLVVDQPQWPAGRGRPVRREGLPGPARERARRRGRLAALPRRLRRV